jgi:hypothetical protein
MVTAQLTPDIDASKLKVGQEVRAHVRGVAGGQRGVREALIAGRWAGGSSGRGRRSA